LSQQAGKSFLQLTGNIKVQSLVFKIILFSGDSLCVGMEKMGHQKNTFALV
jgi:hypothetical protein